MENVIYLEVPYEEKDGAKALGARWDSAQRKWFVPPGKEVSVFSKWAPRPRKINIKAYSPIFIMESQEVCWKCHQSTPVITLGANSFTDLGQNSEFDDFFMFDDIKFIPDFLAKALKEKYPFYFIDFSKTANGNYWMNHCSCNAKLGDFFMHHEPGGAFFPTTDNDLKRITLVRLLDIPELELEANYGASSQDFMKYAQKKETAIL